MNNQFHYRSLIIFGIIIVFAFLASAMNNTYAQRKELAQHDSDIKADIATLDGNMTTEHSDIGAKLDKILAAVQNNDVAGIKTEIVTLVGNLTAKYSDIDRILDKILATVQNSDIAGIKTGIVTLDDNMTAEYSDIDVKLDEILSAVQNSRIADKQKMQVVKTGQNTSYGDRDDGELESGVSWPDPRFTDNLDGTISDNLTQLIWDKNANRFGKRTWAQALCDCNNLADNDDDLDDGSVPNDWRLANVNELQSLLDRGQYKPALPKGHPFSGEKSDRYWTSTTFTNVLTRVWDVDLTNGEVGSIKKNNRKYFWCVRNGQ